MVLKTLIVSTILCFPSLTAAITAVTAGVPELLHGPFLSPQPPLSPVFSFCISLHGPFLSPQTSPISRGGINWSLCRSNSLGTSHSTQE